MYLSNGGSVPPTQVTSHAWSGVLAGILVIVCLAAVSMSIGVHDLAWRALFADPSDDSAQALQVLLVSRLPRTIALILAGAALSVSGLIMQMITRNRFVEPSTAGTVESASLGILVATVLAPNLPVVGKMLAASVFALAGTLVFLSILRRVPLRSVLLVPLIGLMLGGVIDSVTTFFAYRFDLLQSMATWTTGDFSSVLQGRYELLWVAFVLAVLAYGAADRFTIAGVGEAFTTNLGINYMRVMAAGLIIVAMVTATVTVTVGMIPFLGLIVPNLVSMRLGDNARRAIPWVALAGSGFVLLCDIIGRLIRYPYEIPAGTIAGVIGSAVFLWLLLRRGQRNG